MTIIRPNSISGINSITAKNTDQMKLYDSNGAWSHVRAGVVTATSFSGPITGSTGTFGGDVTISGDLGVGGTITYEDVARVDATGISTFREGYHLGPLAGIALTAYKDGSIRTTGIITASSFVGDGSGLTGAGPSLANGVNNRVITASSATALNGEANLTYDGTNLLLGGSTFYIKNAMGDSNGLKLSQESGDESRIFNHYSGALTFGTANTERLRIDSSGNSTFSGQVKVSSSNASTVAFSCGDTGTGFFNTGSNSIGYSANGAEKIRILNGGQMILGGTASTFGGTIPLLELQKSDNATGPKITMYNAASAQAGATCEIQVGHNYREAARVIFGRDNNSNWQASAAAAKSNIQFHTNNAGTVGEKVRVGAGDGSYFMIGTTNNRVTGSSFNYPILGIQHGMNGYNGIGINQIKPNLAGILFKGYQQSSGNYYANYFVDSNSQLCGYVKVHTNNQTVSYTNSSDYRLKQDDVPISDGITRVKQLRPIRFKWKSDLSETQDGFFAHEVQAVVPEAVIGEKDAVMDNQEKAGPNTIDANKILPQQLDTRYMVPLLTAALKEEIAKREALEARVAALESS